MLHITSVHEMSDYMDILSSSSTIYIDTDRLKRAYADAGYAANDLRALTLLWLKIESAGKYIHLSPGDLIDFLLDIGVDLDKRYANRKTKGYSLDMERVIKPLIKAGVCVELLEAYKTLRSYESYVSTLRGLYNANVSQKVTPTGRVLSQFPTTIVEQENLRVYYRDIAVVSIPKLYSSIITGASDNHLLAWCDYPQADWRFAYSLFIRDSSNSEIMQQCTDAYEGLARMVEGDKFDLSTFKERRTDFKVNCLKVFYNSKDSAPVPSVIRDFYRRSPKYARMRYDCSLLFKFRMPIPCVSYFGHEQILPEVYNPEDFIAKAFNTMIQTFTSHVVNETVIRLLNMFWDLGYTRDDINVYYVRHDEPIFMFTPNVIKDAWIFKECSEIDIPGFTPIHLDFYYGRYYKEVDPELSRKINESINTADHVFDEQRLPDKLQHEDYWPIPSVESCYMQFFKEEENTRVVVHNYRTRKTNEFFVPTQDDLVDTLLNCLNGGALAWLGTPQYLYVRTAGIEFLEYAGSNEDTLVKVVDMPDTALISART